MTRITRVSILTVSALATALISAAGCSSANSPTQTAVGGGTGTGSDTGTGTGSSTGGASSTGTGTGTGTGASTGGAAAGTGGASSTGTDTGTGTGTGTLGDPLCGNTAAGTPIAKNGACVAADTQFCYKTCGPQSKGFKTETCTAGAYVEQSGTVTCNFPAGDYSCYKIPTTYDASCPTTAPQATTACSVAACVVCGPSYLDSGGAAKTGYCVCNTTATNPTWSCASTTAWPCPGGTGCT